MSTSVHLTKSKKKLTQIINLLGNPDLTRAQIAKAIGVSTKTVQRVSKEIRPDIQEVEENWLNIRCCCTRSCQSQTGLISTTK